MNTLILAWLCATSLAATPADDALPLPFDSDVTTGTLPNGLRYFIRRGEKPQERAELRLVVLAGSLNERESQRGLAHVVEHLAFNGTADFPGDTLVKTLERLGLQFGAHLNAQTGFDATVYKLAVPTVPEEGLSTGLHVLSEWAGAVSFDPTEVEAERGVIISEWRRWRGANQRLGEQLLPLARGPRFAERLPIGTEAVLNSFDTADVKGFYQTWYRPDHMAVVVVGDVEPSAIEAAITQQFGDLTNPKKSPPRVKPALPPTLKRTRATVVTDPEATQTTVSLLWHQGLSDAHTVADYRQGLEEGLFLSVANERLAALVRDQDSGVVSAATAIVPLDPTHATTSLTVQVVGDDLVGAVERAAVTLQTLVAFGPSDNELKRAVATRQQAVKQAVTETKNQPSGAKADELVRHITAGEPVPGIALEATLHARFLPEITAEAARLAGAARLPLGQPYELVMVAPEGTQLPEASAVEQRVADVYARKLSPAVERDVRGLTLTPPPAGSITERTAHPELGVTEWRLSNGVRVLLKPTDFKEDQVRVAAYSPGGHSHIDDQRYVGAYIADEVVSRSGLFGMTGPDLTESLAGRAVQARPFVGEQFEGFEAAFTREEADLALGLAHQYLVHPQFDEGTLVRMQAALAEQLATRAASPGAAFSDALAEAMWQSHPRRRPWRLVDLPGFRLDDVRSVWQERFADLDDLVVIFVGNVDEALLEGPVTRWLATLPAREGEELWQDIGAKLPDAPVSKVVRRGVDPERAVVRITWFGPFENTPTNAVKLNAAGELFSDHLRQRLREQLGATYDVSAETSTDLIPTQRFELDVELTCAPADVPRLVAEVDAELARMRTTAVPAAELEVIQSRFIRSHEQSLLQNEWWLDGLASVFLYPGRTPEDLLAWPEHVGDLDPEGVRALFAKAVDPNKRVEVVLLPEGAP